MRKGQGKLLFLAHIGMELSWIYAWATFMMRVLVDRPFPLPEAIGTYLFGVLLTLAVRGIGLRVISVLGLQAAGFLLAASRILYALNYRAYPYLDKGWLLECFTKTRSPMEWFILVIIMMFALLLWLRAISLARKSLSYLAICTRFDVGVAAFFLLFIVKSFLLVKGGIEVRASAPELLLFPFFIFSILTISTIRNRSDVRRDFLAGYRGFGVLATFTLLIVAFGAGLVLFCIPYLSVAADAGYGALKTAARPLIPVLVRFLRFFILGAGVKQEPAIPLSGEDIGEQLPPPEKISWLSEDILDMLGWGLLGLVFLAALIFGVLAFRYLVLWLLSRTSDKERPPVDWPLVFSGFQRLWAAVCTGIQKALTRLKGYRDIAQLYGALLKWGRHSGLPHLLNETPAEYGSRLGNRFPSLSGEIHGIVYPFNLAVYGEIPLNDEQITRARLSWKSLSSPRHWPARFKCWFTRP